MSTPNKITYAASSSVTITLAALATSSTLLVGVSSSSIDNTVNLYLDYLIGGRITTGTSPSTNPGTIEVHVVGMTADAIWPDVFDGTSSAKTISLDGVKSVICKPVAIISTTTTSNVSYDFGPVSVANLFGGTCPKKFVVFSAHNTGVNLNATAGNHYVNVTPVYSTNG